jgi:hypothetical protein
MVVSVSRREDIPRFAFGRFLEMLDAGFVEVKNPFNAGQTRRVSLLPPAVFAFWTREPSAILEHAGELEGRGYGFYVMTTLNAYPSLLEPNMPPPEAIVQTMRNLALKITPERVIWRYDPVFLSDITDVEFHRRNFANLASRLKGAVKRVIVSVHDEYARAEKRLTALEQSGALKKLPHYGVDGRLLPAIRDLLAELAQIARGEGMEIQSCAEEDLSDCGIVSGACIDGGYLKRIFGIDPPARDRSQRPRCLCAQSVDIGSYGRCPAGCIYCYASCYTLPEHEEEKI